MSKKRNKGEVFREILREPPDPPGEPEMDMCRCSTCMDVFMVAECETEEDGDWESGYYLIHLCPKCEDGGNIEDYYPSEESLARWRKGLK